MFVAVATIFSSVLFAQTIPTTPPSATNNKAEVKKDMDLLRKDIKEQRKDKMERKADLKAGNKTGAAKITEDIKADKADVKNDVKKLKSEGVKHPVHRAEQPHLARIKRH